MAVGDEKGLIFPNLGPGKATWQLLSAECRDQTPPTVV